MKHIEVLLRREYGLSLIFFEYYHGGIGAMLCRGDDAGTFMTALEDSSHMEFELTSGVLGSKWYPFAVGDDLPQAIQLLDERIKKVYFDTNGELNLNMFCVFSLIRGRIVPEDKFNSRFLGKTFTLHDHTTPTFFNDIQKLINLVDADKENKK